MATPEQKQINAAAREGDLATVRRLLRGDPSLASSWQPIMHAAYRGDAPLIAALLEHGADPNVLSRTVHRHRPLHRAIETRITAPRGPEHVEAVRVLLDGGADPRLPATRSSINAVGLAAMFGEVRFLPLLREAWSDLDPHTSAAVGDAARVSAWLADDSAAASERDQAGWQPLASAAASRLHQHDEAIAAGLLRVARLLLDAGASPNDGSLWGSGADAAPLPALYWAAGWSNNAPMTRLLLDAGAEPNDGEAIYHAAENLYTECGELLLAHGTDLNYTGHLYGNTPLHFLISIGNRRGIPWLLEHGADPNVPSSPDQEQALHAAARMGAGEAMLTLLLQHGADLQGRDGHGNTPLDMARKHGRAAAVEFLQSRGAEA